MNSPVRRAQRRVAIRLAHLPSWSRFLVAALAGQVAWVMFPHSSWRVRLVASWDGFALVALAVTWFTMLSLRPFHIRRLARIEDPSRMLSLVLVLLGAAASLLAVLVLLRSSVPDSGQAELGAIVLALSAVVLAWMLIHTLFTLRYAHVYHGGVHGSGGLDFPGNDRCPEYLDFAYFAFVIGMTAQTSDVTIVSRRMRYIVLSHAVVSFAFNTAVVALSISVLTTLL